MKDESLKKSENLVTIQTKNLAEMIKQAFYKDEEIQWDIVQKVEELLTRKKFGEELKNFFDGFDQKEELTLKMLKILGYMNIDKKKPQNAKKIPKKRTTQKGKENILKPNQQKINFLRTSNENKTYQQQARNMTSINNSRVHNFPKNIKEKITIEVSNDISEDLLVYADLIKFFVESDSIVGFYFKEHLRKLKIDYPEFNEESLNRADKIHLLENFLISSEFRNFLISILV